MNAFARPVAMAVQIYLRSTPVEFARHACRPCAYVQELDQELDNWFETGSAHPEYTTRVQMVANPTLLQPGSWAWQVQYRSDPFSTYHPLEPSDKLAGASPLRKVRHQRACENDPVLHLSECLQTCQHESACCIHRSEQNNL